MNAYKQDEYQRDGSGGTGWRPGAAPRREPELVRKPSMLSSFKTALHTSTRVRLLSAVALLGLSVLGVFAVAFAAAPKPAQVLAAASDLPAGTVVTAADLTTVGASAPSAVVVPVAQEGSIVGQTLRVELPSGTLLSQSDLGSFPPIGSSVVPVAVKAGQYPADLQSGETVAIFPVSAGTSTQADAAHAAATGTVTEISQASESGSNEVVVDLEVATSAAAVVAQAPAVVLVGLDARGDAP